MSDQANLKQQIGRLPINTLWSLLKETVQAWQEDNSAQLGAALAYYTAVSLAPTLIIIVAIAGFIFGEGNVRSELIAQIEGVVGADGAELVGSLITSISTPADNLVATLIAIGTTLLAATGVFAQLQNSLNVIWKVPKSTGGGLRGLIQKRLASFLVLLIMGLLLLALLLLNTLLPAVLRALSDALPVNLLGTVRFLNLLLTFSVLAGLFAVIYRVLPDVEIAWRDVWVGAAVTAGLFTLGQFVLSLYFANTSVGSAYGAAGSLVVILVWIYYSAQIILLGAEFTQVYTNRYGSQLLPEAGSKPEADEADS